MHRDREREERYGGGRDRRGGGGEREWDRDRDRGGAGRGGSRRGADDDDGGRSSRRDGGRDLFDDRVSDRRGGGGRRGDRDRDYDGFGGRDRRRSPSPPPKKREPTPDLTDVVPILERRRRLTQWDIKPPGYENVTAEQAKLSGMFPLPGAPRPQHAVDPSKLQAFMNPSKDGSSAALVNATLRPTNARQSKRIVVRNIPPSATEESLVSFFNLQLNGLNVIESTDPCVGCQMAKDRSFAMLEFRHSSEATVALAFDGISMEAEDYSNGSSDGPQGLKLQRPRDYIVPAVINEPMPEPGVISNVVPDTPNKISVANLPPSLDEEQVKELLSAFGQLKAFVLVRDSGTEESRVELL